MATPTGLVPLGQRILRHSAWDALFLALTAAHAAALIAAPSIPLIAIGMWWNANTVAHNFIHRPFFRARTANRAFSLVLSAVLGVPQALWRERHLEHHAGGVRPRRNWPALAADSAVVAGVWAVLLWTAPIFFVRVYLPGIAIGLGLCQLQGYFEHARGTTSYYGRLYNWLFFNDGLHVEHHERPGTHWRDLPRFSRGDVPISAWPPVLRWIETASLDELERLVLRAPALRRFVLRTHTRAFRALLPQLPASPDVEIVGGGLFPRTALVMRELLPDAHVTIIEAKPAHLAIATAMLGPSVQARCESYVPTTRSGADLLVVPLAFVGDRQQFYDAPPAPAVLVHDWIWRRRGTGVVISWLLLKRLNLVVR